MDITETLIANSWIIMLTKTKPFSIVRAPSLGFYKDLLDDPRKKQEKWNTILEIVEFSSIEICNCLIMKVSMLDYSVWNVCIWKLFNFKCFWFETVSALHIVYFYLKMLFTKPII